MTNNWGDIGNSTLVIAMGANPSENHPACMAHINNARRGPGKYTDRAGNEYTSNKPAAKLVVIDPRKTRTAVLADMYVRIRPGTDIAFVNGLINYMIDAQGTGTGLKNGVHANQWTRFKAFHEATANKNHFPDGVNTATAITGRPKYTDATIKVAGTDYERATFTQGANTITGFPVAVTDIETADTAYMKLKSHVAPYTPAVVADICGCSAAELITVAELMIENSRCSSVAADTDAYSATVNDPKLAGFRSTTMLYAMGITQHTCGSQNVKSFAVIQTLLGNMGRAGGGINALRGIHNVQGSTDMGLLYGNIPAYSGNPGVGQAFGDYMNKLYGNRINGAAGAGATDPYVYTNGGLQQKGFYNMTKAFFGDSSYRGTWDAGSVFTETASAVTDNQANMDGLYAMWPKGNGDNHIKMFRKMLPTYAGTDKITACMVWGQNPAVTEPNQSKIRASLKELDLLVCVDMFANETAMCDRKQNGVDGATKDGVTYLIPACSHVEEAGSATNSGRVLQWRYQAIAPLGNSKTDLELLLRFAKALDGAGAFSHIKQKWNDLGILGGNTADAYEVLYGSQYGWTWGSTFDSETSAKKVYKQMCAPQGNGGTIWIYLDGYHWDRTNRGGDWPDATGATGRWVNGVLETLGNDYPIRAKSRGKSDMVVVSGDSAAVTATKSGNMLYKNWGYAWLVNRRVFYNNGDVPGDQADGFQGAELVSRMFTSTNSGVLDYSTAYRTYHRLSDKVFTSAGVQPAHQPLAARFPSHTEPYESPRPDLASYWGYNSVNGLAIAPGSTDNSYRNLVPTDTSIGAVANFPLVLTTIRCVEHFQGGPITRNNLWNNETEPEAWIEIHSADARKYGIKDGDWVNVITARSNSTTDQTGRTKNNVASTVPALDNFGKGFRAKVGAGVDSNQRVGQGVVAIPWHWGEAGMSTGARANDLCIDAVDANTTIPESKACLCKIVKA